MGWRDGGRGLGWTCEEDDGASHHLPDGGGNVQQADAAQRRAHQVASGGNDHRESVERMRLVGFGDRVRGTGGTKLSVIITLYICI